MDVQKILGLDPANKCGFAHSDGTYGVWKLKLPGDIHPGRRLERFRRHLFSLKRSNGIDVIAFEDASFGSNNPNTASSHSELKGVILLAAAEWDIPVHGCVPSTLKKWLTGNGRAEKPQMIRAVESMFGIRTKSDDIADAIAVMERCKSIVLSQVKEGAM